jgi:hypothetical protein
LKHLITQSVWAKCQRRVLAHKGVNAELVVFGLRLGRGIEELIQKIFTSQSVTIRFHAFECCENIALIDLAGNLHAVTISTKVMPTAHVNHVVTSLVIATNGTILIIFLAACAKYARFYTNLELGQHGLGVVKVILCHSLMIESELTEKHRSNRSWHVARLRTSIYLHAVTLLHISP